MTIVIKLITRGYEKKATKDIEFTEYKAERNKAVSKTRYIVERHFK